MLILILYNRTLVRTYLPFHISKKCKHSHQIITNIIIFHFYSLHSILLSHFILDLRSIYPTASNPAQSSNKTTSLQFATNIEGNLGTSLDVSWATGEGRDIEEDEEIKYSDNPLAAGLLEIDSRTEVEGIEEVPVSG